MDENVTENFEKTKFEIDVPYNNEFLVAERKKSRIMVGVLYMFVAVAFLGLTIWGALSSGPSIALVVVFAILAALCCGAGIYHFCTLKAREKDENKTVKYCFYEDYLQIIQNNAAENGKVKMLENCLYRPYKNKQYVAKVMEFQNKLEVKIFTGTTNGAPQYNRHTIPKSMFETEEELNAFTQFLKEKFSSDYVVKLDK